MALGPRGAGEPSRTTRPPSGIVVRAIRLLPALLLLASILLLVALVDQGAAPAGAQVAPALLGAAGDPAVLEARYALALQGVRPQAAGTPLPGSDGGHRGPGRSELPAPPLSWAVRRDEPALAQAAPGTRDGGDGDGQGPAPGRAAQESAAEDRARHVLRTWGQPVIYAFGKNLAQEMARISARSEYPVLFAVDTATQALLQRTDVDDPLANAVLHVALTTGLVYGAASLRAGRGGRPPRLDAPYLLALALTAGSLHMLEGPGKDLAERLGILPAAAGTTGDGRPVWADPGDYWPHWLYDTAVHGVANGVFMGTLGSSGRVAPLTLRERQMLFLAEDDATAVSPWLPSRAGFGLIAGGIAAVARGASTLLTDPPPPGAGLPRLPAGFQPFTYALLDYGLQHAHGWSTRGELWYVLTADVVTQALLRRTDLDNPVANAALHAAVTTGLAYGLHYGMGWPGGADSDGPVTSVLRRVLATLGDRDAQARLIHGPSRQGAHAMALASAGMIVGGQLLKPLLRYVNWLPTPVGTKDGRLQFATPDDYAWNLVYDGLVTGLATALSVMFTSYSVDVGPGRGVDSWTITRLPWRVTWPSALMYGLISAAGKQVSEFASNPPDTGVLREAALALQALDRVRLRPADDFDQLAWSALLNLGESALTLTGNLIFRNLYDLRVMAERGVLTLRSTLAHSADGTLAERWLGGAAEERRLGPGGDKAAWKLLGEDAARDARAARQRSHSASRKLLAKTPTTEDGHALRGVLSAAALPGNLWDVAMTTLRPDPELDTRDQHLVATRAREELTTNLQRLWDSAEGYVVEKGYRLGGVTRPRPRPPSRPPPPGTDPGRPGRGTPPGTAGQGDLVASVRSHLGGSSLLVGGSPLLVEEPSADDDGPQEQAVPQGHVTVVRRDDRGAPPGSDPGPRSSDPGPRSPVQLVAAHGRLALGLVRDGVEYRLIGDQLVQVRPDGGPAPVDPALPDPDEPASTPVAPPAPTVPDAPVEQAEAPPPLVAPGGGPQPVGAAAAPAPQPAGEQHSGAQPPTADDAGGGKADDASTTNA